METKIERVLINYEMALNELCKELDKIETECIYKQDTDFAMVVIAKELANSLTSSKLAIWQLIKQSNYIKEAII